MKGQLHDKVVMVTGGGTAIPFAEDVSADATGRECLETTIDEYGR